MEGKLLDSLVTDTTVVDSTISEVFNSSVIREGNYGDALSFVIEKGVDLLMGLGSRILLAVIVFFVGKWIIGRLKSVFSRMLKHRKVEVSLSSFLNSLVSVVLTFFLIVTVIGILALVSLKII